MSVGPLRPLLKYALCLISALLCTDIVALNSSAWLELSSPQCNVGLMTLGTESFAEVKLRNTGWPTITILECHASCGCSRVELSKQEISPGETAILRATVIPSTTHRRGEISAVTIRTDGVKQPEIRIPVVTEGVAGLRLAPASLDFGSVPIASLPSVVRAKLICNSGSTLDATSIENLRISVDDPRLSARVHLNPEGDPEIELSLNAGIPAGDYWTHITVSDDLGRFNATAPVHAQVLGMYYANPSSLMLDSGNVSDCTLGRRISISRRKDGTSSGVVVTKVSMPEPLEKAAIAQWEASNVTLRISTEAPTTAFQSRLQQSVQVEVCDDLSNHSVLNVPVVVTVRSDPRNARENSSDLSAK